MKTKILVIIDPDPDLSADLLRLLQAAVRRVQITDSGELVKPHPNRDSFDHWRVVYRKFVQRLFPKAWIYIGGHHLAVHATPPPEPCRANNWRPGEAGRILFHIVESQPMVAEQTKPTPTPQPKDESNDVVN